MSTATSVISTADSEALRETYSLALVYIMTATASKPGHLFYLNFLQCLRLTETTDTEFGAVAFTKFATHGELRLNPVNCRNLTLKQFAGLLVHEVVHVMLGHVHIDSDFRKRHPDLFKIAADLACNQVVEADGYQLPKGKGLITNKPDLEVTGVTLDSVEKRLGMQPPAKETVEYYCEWLKLVTREDGNSSGRSQQELDDAVAELAELTDHDDTIMDEVDEILNADQKLSIMRTVAQAVSEAVENTGGISKIPGPLQAHVRKVLLVLESKLHLDSLLLNFFGGCGRSRKRLRKNRLNRRDELGLPGNHSGMSAGIVMDQSGSRTNPEVAFAYGVAKQVSRVYGLDTYVLEADDGILQEPWNIQDRDLSVQCERVGAGGTNMGPGIDYFVEETEAQGSFAVGGIIVISDGELGPDSMRAPHQVDTPLLYLFSRKRDPFKGRDYAGDCWYFDAETGAVERI